MVPSLLLFHHYNPYSLLLYKEGHFAIGENTTLKGWFKIYQLSHSNIPWALGINYYQELSAAQAFPLLPSPRVKAQRINSLWNPSASLQEPKRFCRGAEWCPLGQPAPRHSICLLSWVYLMAERLGLILPVVRHCEMQATSRRNFRPSWYTLLVPAVSCQPGYRQLMTV